MNFNLHLSFVLYEQIYFKDKLDSFFLLIFERKQKVEFH